MKQMIEIDFLFPKDGLRQKENTKNNIHTSNRFCTSILFFRQTKKKKKKKGLVLSNRTRKESRRDFNVFFCCLLYIQLIRSIEFNQVRQYHHQHTRQNLYSISSMVHVQYDEYLSEEFPFVNV